MRPAGPLAAFHLRFPTQQLMIGLLSCTREGQLLAEPTVPGSVGPNPWDGHQNGHFGGFEAHRVGTEPLCQLRAGLRGTHRCGDAAGSGHRVPLLFWGASCVLCSNKLVSVLVGNPSFPKGWTAPVAFNS